MRPSGGNAAAACPAGSRTRFRPPRRLLAHRGHRNHADGPVSEPLVWAHGVVKIFVFPEQVVEVALSENHEMVQTLVLGTLNPALGKSIQVGRTERKLLHLDSLGFENLVELLRELGVAVPDQI